MRYSNKVLECGLGVDNLSIKDLLKLYNGTVEELKQCANLEPDLDIETAETELKEAALLTLESNILEQAAKIQIRKKEDFLDLMDIWSKAIDAQTEEAASPSDRIAMNIFRHMTGSKFLKD